MLHGSKTWALQREGCMSLMATGHLTLPGGLPVPTSMGGGLGGQLSQPTRCPSTSRALLLGPGGPYFPEPLQLGRDTRHILADDL